MVGPNAGVIIQRELRNLFKPHQVCSPRRTADPAIPYTLIIRNPAIPNTLISHWYFFRIAPNSVSRGFS